MTTIYTIDPTRISAYRRQSIRNSVLLYGSFGLIALLTVNRGDFSPSGLRGIVIGLLAQSIVIGLLIWASMRTFNRQAATLRILLDDETITREADRVPTISLRLADIQRIEEFPKTGIVLRTSDKRTQLYIPELVQEFGALRELLVQRGWPVVRKQSSGQLMLRCAAWGALPVVLMALLWNVPSQGLAMLAGGALVLSMFVAAIIVQRNVNMPRWFKIVGWLIVPLMLLITLQRLSTLS